jgi:hypothetical protein
MSDTKPFLFDTSKHMKEHTAVSVWLLSGRKIRVTTSRWENFGDEPDDVSAKTEHFHGGEWQEVLPYHRIDATGENETPAAHLTLAARTIEFLASDGHGPKWRDESLRDGSI